jgi:hypothetical protein
MLRPRRAFALRAVAPAAVGLAAGAALPAGHPVHRLAALCFLFAAATLILGPLLGTGREARSRSLAAAAGLLIAVLPAALVFGGGATGALLAGAVLGGFLLLLAGVAAGVARVTGHPGAGIGVACGVGAVCLASFHLGDPFLEWDTGAHSPVAVAVLHWMNPMSAAIGDALSFDWLRMRLMYTGFPGTISGPLSASQYHAYEYAAWWGSVVLFAGVGLLLLFTVGRKS